MYKIMIADDEGIVIDALKFIIEKSFGEPCQVRSAKTGRSVIELAESFRPDIALMDIQMPGINGIEAMQEIDTDCGKRLHLLRAVSAKLRPGSFSVQRSAGGYGGQRLHDGH